MFESFVSYTDLFKLLLDIFFSEPPRLRPKHVRKLNLAHANLVSDRHKAGGKIHVVLLQELDRHHEPVDVVEDKGSPASICFFRLEKVNWVVSPMPAWVEVVGGVVAVVEADAVALWYTSATKLSQRAANGFRAYHDVYHRDARPEI